MLARLLQTVENRDPEMAFIEQSRLTMESRNGVKVAFHVGEGRQERLS